MSADLRSLLEFAQGPLFRFALALMLLGTVRLVLLGLLDAWSAWEALGDRREFTRRLAQRLLWHIFPTRVWRQVRGGLGRAANVYHTALCCASLVFRSGAIVIPAFMVAHVYLWELGLGLSWPALSTQISDALTYLTIAAGLAVFFGRIYSPLIRAIDPPWAFAKPLILLAPFVTGMLAMHPTWSPLDYHFVMLLHVLCAALVLVLIPFGRLLTFMHTPLSVGLPELAWPPIPREAGGRKPRTLPTQTEDPALGRERQTVSS